MYVGATISLSGTVYGPVYLTSVRISAYDITTSGSFNCTNCSIEASWMSNSGNPINLLYNNSMPNRENMYVNVSGSLTLTKNFRRWDMILMSVPWALPTDITVTRLSSGEKAPANVRF